MGTAKLPAPNVREIAAGDRMFAWMMRGYNAAGEAVHIKGHMTCTSEAEALKDLEAGLALIKVADAAHRPTVNVIIDVWEIPAGHMAALLRAAGYDVKLPDHLRRLNEQAGGRR